MSHRAGDKECPSPAKSSAIDRYAHHRRHGTKLLHQATGVLGQYRASARCNGTQVHQSSDSAPTTRYPTLGMVSIAGGSPSFRRRRLIVTVTVLVNGSTCSSQT